VEDWDAFDRAWGGGLGCQTDVLYLLGRNPGQDELRHKILGSDVIYVGGGNTLMMMRRWRRLGVDKLLMDAWQRDTVMCGVSAGAICWFRHGHSDSMSFYDPNNWRYVSVAGLGMVNALACPHYDSDTMGVPRRDDFKGMVLKRGGMAVGIENRCALAFVDDQFRVVAQDDAARAFKLYRSRGAIVEAELQNREEWLPLSALLQRD
jgi:dipeptidase E